MIRINDHLALRKLHSQLLWDYHFLDRVPDDVFVGPVGAETGFFEVIDRPQDVSWEIGAKATDRQRFATATIDFGPIRGFLTVCLP